MWQHRACCCQVDKRLTIGEEAVIVSWPSVVVAAVVVAQVHHHHHHFVVVQSLPFHCVGLVASYYSNQHRHGQYRRTSTRKFGAATNNDDHHHHRRQRQQRCRSFVLSIVWLFVESGASGCHCPWCISVIDRLNLTTISRRRRWPTVSVEASIGDMTDAVGMLAHCIVLVQVVVVICHTSGCWASWPSLPLLTTNTKGPVHPLQCCC